MKLLVGDRVRIDDGYCLPERHGKIVEVKIGKLGMKNQIFVRLSSGMTEGFWPEHVFPLPESDGPSFSGYVEEVMMELIHGNRSDEIIGSVLDLLEQLKERNQKS